MLANDFGSASDSLQWQSMFGVHRKWPYFKSMGFAIQTYYVSLYQKPDHRSESVQEQMQSLLGECARKWRNQFMDGKDE